MELNSKGTRGISNTETFMCAYDVDTISNFCNLSSKYVR